MVEIRWFSGFDWWFDCWVFLWRLENLHSLCVIVRLLQIGSSQWVWLKNEVAPPNTVGRLVQGTSQGLQVSF